MCIWEYNIKLYLKEIELQIVEWDILTQNMVHSRVLLKKVMIFSSYIWGKEFVNELRSW